MALLYLRRTQQHTGRFDPTLDQNVRRQLVKSCVFRGQSLPGWLQNGAEFGEQGLELMLDTCLVNLATLRQKALELRQHAKRSVHSVRQLIIQAQANDD